MFRRSLFAIILLIVFIVAVLSVFPPAPLPVEAPTDVFSAARAAETIRIIARSPRLVGSPTFEMAREYLLAQLSSLGLTTETQDLELEGMKVENTLGRLTGISSEAAILLVAHLDSVAESPGAMDNASGVAEVLETVRALKAGPALANTIIVLFTAPEEICCLGAKAFATRHPWAGDVRLVINVDAGGIGGPSILAATGPGEGWMIRQMASILPHPIASSAIEAFGDPATDYADALRPAGLLGFDFNLSWDKRIHTPDDNIKNVHLSSIQHQGEHMLALVRQFGGLPLGFPEKPNPVYFDLLSLFIVQYPASWTIPLFGVLTIVMILTLIQVFQKKWLGWQGMVLGAMALSLSGLTVPLMLLFIQRTIIEPRLASSQAEHIRQALLGESSLSNGIRWGAVVLTVLAVIFWNWLAIKLNKGDRDELVIGEYLLLFIAAGGTTAFFQLLSYILVWPLLFGLTAMLIRFLVKGSSEAGSNWITLIGWSLAAVTVIIFFVPEILVAIPSVDIQMVYLVPVFVAILGSFLSGPVLMAMERRKR
jgi:hypothetical protein